ncbi:MAG TPA: hypothetical protein VFT31_07960 [Kribbella sp.]|nr:hypothetical protein [Kribbella sp.]
MSRHTGVLLGEALTELRKWDPAAADQIVTHVREQDLPGVERGMAGTGVIEPLLPHRRTNPGADDAAASARRLRCVADDRDRHDRTVGHPSLADWQPQAAARDEVA